MKKGMANDGVVFHAGFPNAGEDQVSHALSLDSTVLKHPASTFLWRLEQAMPELGWQASSVVVVDRALVPRQNDLVVAIAEEDFVVRRLHQKRLYDPAGALDETQNIAIWGVVTHVLLEYRS